MSWWSPSARSACCNRSWSGRWVARGSSSSWANADWRAAQQAERGEIPAIVRDTADHELLRDALLENLHRAQLQPSRRGGRVPANAGRLRLHSGGAREPRSSAPDRRSPTPSVSLRLPPTVQRRIAAGVISAGHAKALLAIEDPAGQERLAQRVVARRVVGARCGGARDRGRMRETGSSATSVSPRLVAPKVKDLADRLSDHFETRVKVATGQDQGQDHHRVRRGRRLGAHCRVDQTKRRA